MVPIRILRQNWLLPSLVLGVGALAFLVTVALSPPRILQANPPQPCSDLNGDGYVDNTDLQILLSYYDQTVPPAPVQADLMPDGIINGLDQFTLLNDAGTYTDCQTKPIFFKNGLGVDITKTSRVDPQPVPGSCFDIEDAANTTVLFSVCDNDFQSGMPQVNALCSPDGTAECEDSDPAVGSISVAVQAGDYSVVEGKPPFNHAPDTNKYQCTAAGGPKCELAFENVVIDAPTPWFPWDTNGDNSVSGLDFFEVLAHFNESKP